MREYCVYSRDPNFAAVIEWLQHRNITVDLHLNRTRFWLKEAQLVELLLQYAGSIYTVLPDDDFTVIIGQ